MTKETAMGDHHHHGHGPHEHGPVDWKHNGIKVIPGDQLDPNTAQTPGMNRAAAINLARAGAQKLWAGTVKIHPNAKTGASSEEHTSELQSLMRISYAVFCLKTQIMKTEHIKHTKERH